MKSPRREAGRLYEIPILIFLVIIVMMGVSKDGFGWRALAVPVVVILFFVALWLLQWAIEAIAEAVARYTVARLLDRILAGAPAEPLIAAVQKQAWSALRHEALKRDALLEMATQAGPSRAAILAMLMYVRDKAIEGKLRPLVRARLDLLEESDFGRAVTLFLNDDDADPEVALALVARAAPPVRRELLRAVLGSRQLGPRGSSKELWLQLWAAPLATFRDDLLAMRDPERTPECGLIDAMLAAFGR